MAKRISQQEAYQALVERLGEAAILKKQYDTLIEELERFAWKHDIVMEQRTVDGVPEVLDPALLERNEHNDLVFKQDYEDDRGTYEAGEPVDYWIPSSLC